MWVARAYAVVSGQPGSVALFGAGFAASLALVGLGLDPWPGTFVAVLVGIGTSALNVALALGAIPLLASRYAGKVDRLLVRILRAWAAFVPACLLAASAGAAWRRDLAIALYGTVHGAILAALFARPFHSAALYYGPRYPADARFAARHPNQRVAKLALDGELRNALFLDAGRDLHVADDATVAIGIPAHPLDERVVVTTSERTVRVALADHAPGWHSLGPAGATRIAHTGRSATAVSVRTPHVVPDARQIVLLVLDGLSPSHLGCLGGGPTLTPTIDSYFSGNGCRAFTQAYSQGEWTLPTFASMATSMYASRHGVHDPNRYSRVLPTGIPVLAELLQDRDFQTFGYVSGSRSSARYGQFRGFDEFVNRETIGARGRHDHRQITDRALRVLDGGASENVFMMLHYVDTHAPYFPSVADRVRLGDDAGMLLRAKLHALDGDLDRLFRALDPVRSMVILSSDHGPAGKAPPGAPGVDVGVHANHVPLLLRCPWRLDSRALVDTLVESSIDVLPTILDAIGLPCPAHAEGTSLLASASDRRPYAISESIYLGKYEATQRFSTHANYVHLTRDRRTGVVSMPADLEARIVVVSPDSAPRPADPGVTGFATWLRARLPHRA